MIRKILLVCMGVFQLINANAQSDLYHPKYGISFGYLGKSLINPGIQIGLENTIDATNKFQIIGIANIHYYTHKEVSSGIGLNLRFGQRYLTSYGLFIESYLGVGIQATQFKTEKFSFSLSSVSVQKETVTKPGVSPHLIIGMGYDFSKKLRSPLKYFLRGGVYWLYPDQNLLFQTFPSVETGVVYYPKFY